MISRSKKKKTRKPSAKKAATKKRILKKAALKPGKLLRFDGIKETIQEALDERDTVLLAEMERMHQSLKRVEEILSKCVVEETIANP
jgi:adenylate kinase family enzyme